MAPLMRSAHSLRVYDSKVSWRCNHSIMAASHTGLFTLITLQIIMPFYISHAHCFLFMGKFEFGKTRSVRVRHAVLYGVYAHNQSHGMRLNY
jgi:hypothetical protein